MIKLLIGGSPCTHWSIAQKNNRETKPEGLGWELFKNFLIAKEKFKPDFFLYENNKSAAQAIKDQISKELGVDLMYINSALVSAQNRQRFYAFNWEVEQPEDRGILLRDILETFDNARCISEREMDYMVRDSTGKYNNRWSYLQKPGENEKALCLTSNIHKGVPYNICAEPVRISEVENVGEPFCIGEVPGHNGAYRNGKQPSQQYRVYSIDGKSVACDRDGRKFIAEPICIGDMVEENEIPVLRVPEATKQGYVEIYTGDCVDLTMPNSKTRRGRSMKDKCNCLTKQSAYYQYCGTIDKPIYEVKDGFITIKGKQYPIKLKDGYYIIRKLTPIECERLQTLPDNYTAAVSDAQRYKGLGNGWTAEVIIHILNGVLKDVPKDEEIIVLSMYDGIGTGRYCLDKMGFTNVKYYAYEIDKYAKQVSMSNYPDIIQCGDAFDLRNPDWTIGY